MLYDLGASVASALHDAIKRGLVHQLRDRNARDCRIAGKRDHGVAVPSENECVHVLDADLEFLRDKSAETRRVEHSGHPNHTLAWEPADLISGLRHGIKRIRHDNQNAVRRVVYDLADNVAHDLVVGVKKIIAAHTRLAGDSGGDDDDVSISGVGIVVRAKDSGIAFLDRHGLEQVETFALRDAFYDVDQHDVCEFFGGDPVGGSRTHVSGAYDGDFIAHEVFSSGAKARIH